MKGKPKPFLRNSEIDELCVRLIYEYMGDDGAGKPVDIIGFTTGFLKLTILYANIAEEDMSKLGFLADGRTPLLVSCKGQTVSHVFPEKTIVPDRFLNAEKERNRRFFTIAHEAFHYLNSLVNHVPQQAEVTELTLRDLRCPNCRFLIDKIYSDIKEALGMCMG